MQRPLLENYLRKKRNFYLKSIGLTTSTTLFGIGIMFGGVKYGDYKRFQPKYDSIAIFYDIKEELDSNLKYSKLESEILNMGEINEGLKLDMKKLSSSPKFDEIKKQYDEEGNYPINAGRVLGLFGSLAFLGSFYGLISRD